MKLFTATLIILTSSLINGTPVFISTPKSVNASLNTMVQFECKCHYCVGQYWLVNGQSASLSVNINKGVTIDGPTVYTNGSKYYTLSMPASVELNGSSVQCGIYNGSAYPESTLVYLLVQGYLSAVNNVQWLQINESSFFISFTPPFTLQGVPISHFKLQLNDREGINITTTHYTVTVNDTCVTYNVSIRGWNDVGPGNMTHITDITLYQVPRVVSTPVITTEYNNFETLEGYIHFQFNTSCVSTIPQALVLQKDHQQQQYKCSLIDTLNTNCTVTNGNASINITDILQYGAIHDFNMTLLTTGNKSITFNFTINTYHVISARIVISTGEIVCVECLFRLHSPSTGCTVLFHDVTNSNRTYQLMINKQMNTLTAANCITSLPNGRYTVSVLDNEVLSLGMTTNSAVNISQLVTISRPSSTLISTVLMSTSTNSIYTTTPTTSVVVDNTSSDQEEGTLSSIQTTSDTLLSTEGPVVSNSNQVSMATQGSSVLITAVSSVSGIITCLLIIIAVTLTVYLIKEKRKSHIHKMIHEERIKQKESNDIILQCTATDTVTNMQPCLAYDTLPHTTATANPVYDTVTLPQRY